jgi:hypothetical protein
MRHDSWIIRAIALFLTGLPGVGVAAAASSPESRAVDKDGLAITVVLKQESFGTDPQWPRFAVQFKNVSQADIHLYGVEAYWNWKMWFTKKGPRLNDAGAWLLRFEPVTEHPKAVSRVLKPGEAMEVAVDLNKTPRADGFEREGVPAHPNAKPIQHLPPGSYEMAVQIELQADPDDRTTPYWTGPAMTHPVEIEAQDVETIYGNAISRVVGTFDQHGLWNNGVYPIIKLPPDADVREVIAQAAKGVYAIKSYRVLDMRRVSIDSLKNLLKEPAWAAVIQTDTGVKVLIFYSYGDASKGWWTRFYDASLAPATQPVHPAQGGGKARQ